MSTVGVVPFWLTAVAELALLPALLALLAPPILRSAQSQRAAAGRASACCGSSMARFSSRLQRGDAALAGGAMRLAIDLVLILVTVIGGRIVPAFTANALRQRGETAQHRHASPARIRGDRGNDRDRHHRRVRARFVAERCAGRHRGVGARRPAQRLAQFPHARRTDSLGAACRLRLAAGRAGAQGDRVARPARPGP